MANKYQNNGQYAAKYHSEKRFEEFLKSKGLQEEQNKMMEEDHQYGIDQEPSETHIYYGRPRL